MKKYFLKFNTILLLGGLFFSCKPDEIVKDESTFYGTFKGSHKVLVFDYDDTFDITAGGSTTDNKVNVYSHLLNVNLEGNTNGEKLTIPDVSFVDLPIPGTSDSILSALGSATGTIANGNKFSTIINVNATTTLSGFETLKGLRITGTFYK
ncbi:MAG: hypothetical protein IPH74_08160 [Bacteroidetes bacterium]|nr:hypothetical protein [Bacteroidota bacterium]